MAYTQIWWFDQGGTVRFARELSVLEDGQIRVKIFGSGLVRDFFPFRLKRARHHSVGCQIGDVPAETFHYFTQARPDTLDEYDDEEETSFGVEGGVIVERSPRKANRRHRADEPDPDYIFT